MPIPMRDVRDLRDVDDEQYQQLVMGLDLPEVEAEGVLPEEARRRSETARQALLLLRGQKDAPEWLPTWEMLMDKGWPSRQAAYIAWASTPSDKRSPKTQQELAVLLGLGSDRAISTWRKKNPAILETIALLQSAPLWDSRSDAFAGLIAGMKKAGDDYKFYHHLELYLKLTGDYVPTANYVAELKRKLSTDPAEMSEEEVQMLARAFDAYQQDKVIDKDDGD